jgi:hypothetical protein
VIYKDRFIHRPFSMDKAKFLDLCVPVVTRPVQGVVQQPVLPATHRQAAGSPAAGLGAGVAENLLDSRASAILQSTAELTERQESDLIK